MSRKPFAWCTKHAIIVTPGHYHRKCKFAKQGRECKSLSWKTPDWKREQKKSSAMHKSSRRMREE